MHFTEDRPRADRGDEQGPTCAGFLLRATHYFAAHGINRIERVTTDNHFS